MEVEVKNQTGDLFYCFKKFEILILFFGDYYNPAMLKSTTQHKCLIWPKSSYKLVCH